MRRSDTWDLDKGRRAHLGDRVRIPGASEEEIHRDLLSALAICQDDKGSQQCRASARPRNIGKSSARMPWHSGKALGDSRHVTSAGSKKSVSIADGPVSFADGATEHSHLVRSQDHLPAAIRTREDDNIHGD